ncbi:hypothetical protein LTS08_005598 [Lithohypha guttulata]|nr:hypothetical protein LTS08_005598 [Lithohypha guttulata]
MAPASTSERYRILLAILVVVTLPITTCLLWFNYAAVVLVEQRKRLTASKLRQPENRTILITGTDNAFGLNLARAFHKAGYKVIGADSRAGSPSSIAKRSRAVSKHYDLPRRFAGDEAPYVARSLFVIARREAPCLWIDCSNDLSQEIVADARSEIESGMSCKCLVLDSTISDRLSKRDTLLELLSTNGLPSPEFHKVKSRAQIHKILNHAPGQKKYLLGSPERDGSPTPRTLLPQRTLSQTYNKVSLVKVAEQSPMVLEESTESLKIYQCLAVVVRGSVDFFVARPKSELRHEPLLPDSGLWRAMRTYTNSMARLLDLSSSHLVLHFGLNEQVTQAGVLQQILLIECNTRVDPTFVLSIARKDFDDLSRVYRTLLESHTNGNIKSSSGDFAKSAITFTADQSRISRQQYLLPDELITQLIRPCIEFIYHPTRPRHVLSSLYIFMYRLLLWDEAYYDFWDPLPAFWHYSLAFLWKTFLR